MNGCRAIFVAALLLSGCAATSRIDDANDETTEMASVTGSVTYRQRIALAPSAEIKVQLVDVSRADAPAIVLGEQIIDANGRQVPFAFEIPYLADSIEANHSYAVQARIEVGGRLLFISDQNYAVITRGAPSHVDMVLKAVGGVHDR